MVDRARMLAVVRLAIAKEQAFRFGLATNKELAHRVVDELVEMEIEEQVRWHEANLLTYEGPF